MRGVSEAGEISAARPCAPDGAGADQGRAPHVKLTSSTHRPRQPQRCRIVVVQTCVLTASMWHRCRGRDRDRDIKVKLMSLPGDGARPSARITGLMWLPGSAPGCRQTERTARRHGTGTTSWHRQCMEPHAQWSARIGDTPNLK
jgi:hypothetical protein